MKYLNLLTGNIFTAALFVGWIMGVVLAKGFWLVTLSIFFPFYAWYLVIEKVMIISGFGI
jgi:hypothetical protein